MLVRTGRRIIFLISLSLSVFVLLFLQTPRRLQLNQLQQAYRDFTGTTGIIPRKMQGLAEDQAQEDDYGEESYYSIIRYDDKAKANVEEILEHHWAANRTALLQTRSEMRKFFNPYKMITMTSDDDTRGQLKRFYSAKAKAMTLIPPGLRKLLPTKQLFRNQYFKTCSVVGNSGILLNSSCGAHIDAADFSFRCNFATVKGYEKDVGTKTDVITFNPSILDRFYGRLKKDEDKRRFEERLVSYGKYVLWIPIFSTHYVSRTVHEILDYFNLNFKRFKNIQLAFPGNILPDISDYWLTQGIDEDRISTGLLMFNIAATICEEIHMYGFYPFPQFQDISIPYHYDDSRKNRTRDNYDYGYRRFHQLPDEFVLLKKLHKAGVIKLHLGECPT
ncbi:sia-alpha-2,3-Gal-beta-1,4-GlcNAc-R:alpha 2,8-sialyltransferase-like [Lytechinus variegatus]|uniref:sia-alpha-2,3-Gal-beta-1,4-GlcNAc-R:alpha 2,8-sialyltransferase-like n=1 Tax=Lytechinus variegatus TaxID=7654 RepID=UPI001BB21447|nr:sia-alpha-2,3-Gal-beta-1,4-GlcNAc-R:alpha 2,8-sialyltransferase-like [Lytechinus variegatus]